MYEVRIGEVTAYLGDNKREAQSEYLLCCQRAEDNGDSQYGKTVGLFVNGTPVLACAANVSQADR